MSGSDISQLMSIVDGFKITPEQLVSSFLEEQDAIHSEMERDQIPHDDPDVQMARIQFAAKLAGILKDEEDD